MIVQVEVDPLIPKSSGSVPSYHRLQRQPPPPLAPPIRPSSASSASSAPLPVPSSSTPKAAKASSVAAPSTPKAAKAPSVAASVASQRLAPTPNISAAAKAKVSAAASEAKAPAIEPKAPIPVPKTPPKAPPKAKARPVESPGSRPGLTDEPVVDLPRSVLLFNPDTFGRCNFRVEDSQRIEGKVVIFDFHNVIDRSFWVPRIGQRKTQYKIPYPSDAPELLADIQSLLKRVHRAAQEADALVVICSHIGVDG